MVLRPLLAWYSDHCLRGSRDRTTHKLTCVSACLSAGDYLYVFGEMDEDGFYQGQLMDGETGLVPSNFIERVMDDTGGL